MVLGGILTANMLTLRESMPPSKYSTRGREPFPDRFAARNPANGGTDSAELIHQLGAYLIFGSVYINRLTFLLYNKKRQEPMNSRIGLRPN